MSDMTDNQEKIIDLLERQIGLLENIAEGVGRSYGSDGGVLERIKVLVEDIKDKLDGR